jgi:hypothetical protein
MPIHAPRTTIGTNGGNGSLPVSMLAVTPTEGSTVTCPNIPNDMSVQMTPATMLNAITLVLPNEATSRVGQRVFVRSSLAIQQMTVTGATTVDNAVVMFNPGDCVVFFKSAANIWSRVV